MGILPWSSTRGRSHPRGGRARLSSAGPVEDAELVHAELAHDELAHAELVLDELADDPELAAGWQAVVAVASAPPSPGELAGLEDALDHFRAAVPVSTASTRDEGGRHMTPTTWGNRIGVAAAGVLLLGFGGAGAFALTGSTGEGHTAAVPAGVTTTVVPAAPASASAPSGSRTGTDDESDDPADDADESGTPKSGAAATTAVGPDATGPAAHGLCTAWSHAKPSKRTTSHSVAFRNLVTAAGGEAKVDAYCASVPRPSGDKGEKPAGHPTGRPSGKPGKGSAHPTGKPSTLPGKPSTLPGKPSTVPGTPPTTPGGPAVTPTAGG